MASRTMRAFLIDPAKQGERAELPGFLKLGVAREGWEVSRPVAFDMGMDGARWLSDLRRGIEQADIVVGLGNFFALIQAETELDELLMAFRRKISSGCPTLLSGCANLWSNAFPAGEQKIRALFDTFGIHLTSTKVASRIQEFVSHSSNLCCGFRKEDDALFDPGLFEGVESVWAYGSRLIQYEPEVFPLIEASGLHFFVDEGDLRTIGNLGRRNAVAVKRVRNGQYLMVLAGGFFRDRADTFGGVMPGLEDNKHFAEMVISELTAHVSKPIDFGARSYVLFRELEARLGELVQKVLTRASYDGQFMGLLPAEVQNKLRGDAGVPDYSRAMYVDLVNIVHKLWPQFESIFADSAGEPLTRNAVTRPLSSLNKQRNYLAHPHKAKQHGREENSSDVEALSRALEMIRLAAAKAST